MKIEEMENCEEYERMMRKPLGFQHAGEREACITRMERNGAIRYKMRNVE